MSVSESRPRFWFTSLSLWQQRAELEQIVASDAANLVRETRSTLYTSRHNGVSAKIAQLLASITRNPVLTLQEGLFAGYHPDLREPSPSFFLSSLGDDKAEPHDITAEEAVRISSLMEKIRLQRLERYNHLPIVERRDWGIPESGRYVVLDTSSFLSHEEPADLPVLKKMLATAKEYYPEARCIVIGDAKIQPSQHIAVLPKMNSWAVIEQAEAVFVKSGTIGIQALIARKPVHCFADCPYARYGLTVDHFAAAGLKQRLTIQALLFDLLVKRSRYLDLYERRLVEAEIVLDQLITVREQRNRLQGPIVTGGLSPWKRKALEPFLIGPHGRATHYRSKSSARKQAAKSGATIATWGSDSEFAPSDRVIRFEDGFIRSRGLGANLTLPCSLATDRQFIYYDARGESGLERILATHPFPRELQLRARELIGSIVDKGISKYNLDSAFDPPNIDNRRLKILVPGQVEKDASIRFGSPLIKTNAQLVSQVRKLFGGAFIVYKEHPDVSSGLRSGGITPADADIIVRSGDIQHWINWSDRVETMTSLAGFEALIRGKAVGVHGIPFYAGWGLTDDRLPIERRHRALTVEMLAAGALIMYPLYVHPLNAMACTPEALIEEIARRRNISVSWFMNIKLALFQSINRAAVKIRDRRS